MARGISEGASKKNLVVVFFGDVFGHSFFFFLTCIQIGLITLLSRKHIHSKLRVILSLTVTVWSSEYDYSTVSIN